MTAHTVSAFGGPVPLDVPFYRTYIRDTLACLKETMVQDFQYFHTRLTPISRPTPELTGEHQPLLIKGKLIASPVE